MSKSFLNLPLNSLKFMGFNILKKAWFENYFLSLEIIFLILFETLLLLEVFINWSGAGSLYGVCIMTSLYQVPAKLYPLIMKRKLIIKLVKYAFECHNREECNEINKIINPQYAFMAKGVQMFTISCFISAILYLAAPLILHKKTLPFNAYVLPGKLYEISYILIIVTYYLFVCLVSGFDGLFYTLIATGLCEFKILQYKFKTFRWHLKASNEIFKHLIDYHNKTLCFLHELNEVYSVYLVHEILSNLCCVAMGIFSFVVLGSFSNLQVTLPFLGFVIVVFFQQSSYCYLGSCIEEECAKLGDIIFYLTAQLIGVKEFNTYLILIIQRAQRTKIITVGNTYNLNLEFYCGVLRFSLSFLNLLVAFYDL